MKTDAFIASISFVLKNSGPAFSAKARITIHALFQEKNILQQGKVSFLRTTKMFGFANIVSHAAFAMKQLAKFSSSAVFVEATSIKSAGNCEETKRTVMI